MNKLSKEEFKDLSLQYIREKQIHKEILKDKEYRSYSSIRKLNKKKIYKNWYTEKHKEGLTDRDIRLSTRRKMANI